MVILIMVLKVIRQNRRDLVQAGLGFRHCFIGPKLEVGLIVLRLATGLPQRLLYFIGPLHLTLALLTPL